MINPISQAILEYWWDLAIEPYGKNKFPSKWRVKVWEHNSNNNNNSRHDYAYHYDRYDRAYHYDHRDHVLS